MAKLPLKIYRSIVFMKKKIKEDVPIFETPSFIFYSLSAKTKSISSRHDIGNGAF